jgi:hypothetical protein
MKIPPHNDTNGWQEYKRLVISELERTNSRLESVDRRLGKIERNIAILQTKAAAYAAGISVVISGTFFFFTKLLGE